MCTGQNFILFDVISVLVGKIRYSNSVQKLHAICTYCTKKRVLVYEI